MDVICPTCGNKIKKSGEQKTGRPVQYHKKCRELNNAISLLQNRIESFKALDPSKEKRNQIRRVLWNAANGMNGTVKNHNEP